MDEFGGRQFDELAASLGTSVVEPSLEDLRVLVLTVKKQDIAKDIGDDCGRDKVAGPNGAGSRRKVEELIVELGGDKAERGRWRLGFVSRRNEQRPQMKPFDRLARNGYAERKVVVQSSIYGQVTHIGLVLLRRAGEAAGRLCGHQELIDKGVSP